MMAAYGTLPAGSRTELVDRFTIEVPDEEIERMHTLVKLSGVASPSYENSFPVEKRDLGLSREWLIEAKRSWEAFDWKKKEKHMNSFPNFKATIPVAPDSSTGPTLRVHFVALFSGKKDAVPILLPHGWPGSFLEFLPILSLLREKYPDPAELPYHLVVPSLPGYTLSDAPPLDRDFGLADVAAMLEHLMAEVLGFPEYVAQGGDVGSRVVRILASTYPKCKAGLLNYSPVPAPDGFDMGRLTDAEQGGLERWEWFKSRGAAYALLQGTRPATLGLVLSSNPLALLAWVAEKFLDWTDPASFPADAELGDGTPYSRRLMGEAVLSASLYWLTGKAHTCLYSYRETYSLGGAPPKSHASPEWTIRAPKKLGFSHFPFELAPVPRSWVAATGNLVFWKEHQKGGHFAALEQPQALLQDLEEFVHRL